MTKLTDLVKNNASIEAIKADLYDNRNNKDYVNAKSGFGNTALILASKHGHTETARELITAGADVNAKNNVGDIALMLASLNGYTETAKLLQPQYNYLMLNGKKYIIKEVQ